MHAFNVTLFRSLIPSQTQGGRHAVAAANDQVIQRFQVTARVSHQHLNSPLLRALVSCLIPISKRRHRRLPDSRGVPERAKQPTCNRGPVCYSVFHRSVCQCVWRRLYGRGAAMATGRTELRTSSALYAWGIDSAGAFWSALHPTRREMIGSLPVACCPGIPDGNGRMQWRGRIWFTGLGMLTKWPVMSEEPCRDPCARRRSTLSWVALE